MKKPLYELTLAETERLIKCKDDNGEWMCSKGCKFRFMLSKLGCCHKHAFYGILFDYFDEQGLLSESDNGWEIEL